MVAAGCTTRHGNVHHRHRRSLLRSLRYIKNIQAKLLYISTNTPSSTHFDILNIIISLLYILFQFCSLNIYFQVVLLCDKKLVLQLSVYWSVGWMVLVLLRLLFKYKFN